MIKVYGIPNCNTVKKAIDWLKEHNVEYEFHDYKVKGITATKLKQWTKHFGWENILKQGRHYVEGVDRRRTGCNYQRNRRY
jgi:arsenate reductase